MTKEEAIIIADSEWFKDYSEVEITAFQLYEPKLCCPSFDIFQKAVGTSLGRPVWTREFSDAERLKKEFEQLYPNAGELTEKMNIALTKILIDKQNLVEETIYRGDIHTSPDFQCDQTGGYPTVLVWNKDRGTAILQPSPAFDDDSEQAKQCIRNCADWGVHPCTSWEDYNDLLESIGDEAYENAAVPLDDEGEDEKFGEKSDIFMNNVHISPDFQCDQTNGYPTVLCWSKEVGLASLEPSPAFDNNSEDAEQCWQNCALWSIHPCTSWEDYNSLLKSLGGDAYVNAAVPLDDEDESEKLGGMTLQ